MGEHAEKFRGEPKQTPRKFEFQRPAAQRAEGVRGRAESAQLELRLQLAREIGKLPTKEAQQYIENAADQYNHGRSIIRESMHDQFRARRGIAKVHEGIVQTRENSSLAFYTFLSGKESIRDPQAQKDQRRLIDLARKLLQTRNRKGQDRITKKIASITGTKYDDATVRKFSFTAARIELNAEFAEKALSNEAVAKALEAEALKTDDAEAAFAAALQASPELQALYKQQEDFWKSEHVADAFGTPQVPGKKIEEASPKEWKHIFDQVSGQGIALHVNETGGMGELHFGDMVRQCAVYRVDGNPQFFIFDRNADRGIVGPFEPASIRTELARLQIDEFFSQKFREFSTTESEKDPTKVGDQKLTKIVRAFLPNRAENSSEHLSADERKLLTNLARLLVTNDPAYPSLSSKIEFFERILAQPEKVTLAAAALGESDFGKTRMTLKQIEGISL